MKQIKPFSLIVLAYLFLSGLFIAIILSDVLKPPAEPGSSRFPAIETNLLRQVEDTLKTRKKADAFIPLDIRDFKFGNKEPFSR